MGRKKKRKVSRKKIVQKQLFWFCIFSLLVIFVAYHFKSEIKATISISQNSQREMSGTSHYNDLEIPSPLTALPEQIIRHKGYAVSYNEEWKIPNWVAYELTRDEAKGEEGRSDKFEVDPHVATRLSATNADYTRSGYDRGHMAPAGDMKWDTEAMKQSFYFSNICPQRPGLNRKAWKWLESKIRYWVHSDSALVVICGPIVTPDDRTIGKNGVKVPSAFYKIVCAPYLSTPKGIAFIMSNDNQEQPLSHYVVSIDSVERVTGIDFLPVLPDEVESRIEAVSDLQQWKF